MRLDKNFENVDVQTKKTLGNVWILNLFNRCGKILLSSIEVDLFV